jgi:hypothetical protein
VAEPVVCSRRFDSDVADPATLAGVEVTEDVDTATHAARPTVDRLVAECVGKSLHGMARCDRISVEVQLPVDLDESHRSVVAREHSQAARTQMAAPQRVRVRRLRRNRRRPAAMRHTESVHDVFRLDAWPHDDTELGQFRSNAGEFGAQRALRFVQSRRLVEKRRAFRVERHELPTAVRYAAIALRIFDRRHWGSLGREDPLGGSTDRARDERVTTTALQPTDGVCHSTRQSVWKILSKNLRKSAFVGRSRERAAIRARGRR